MKSLKIKDKRAFYTTKEGDETIVKPLETITPEELKLILSDAYFKEEFLYDELIEGIDLSNPIEEVIYHHLNLKLKDIRAKREESIKEIEDYFDEIISEYE